MLPITEASERGLQNLIRREKKYALKSLGQDIMGKGESNNALNWVTTCSEQWRLAVNGVGVTFPNLG